MRIDGNARNVNPSINVYQNESAYIGKIQGL